MGRDSVTIDPQSHVPALQEPLSAAKNPYTVNLRTSLPIRHRAQPPEDAPSWGLWGTGRCLPEATARNAQRLSKTKPQLPLGVVDGKGHHGIQEADFGFGPKLAAMFEAESWLPRFHVQLLYHFSHIKLMKPSHAMQLLWTDFTSLNLGNVVGHVH